MITYTGRPGQASPALGLLLVGAATVLLVPAVTASLSNVLAALVMALTSARFFLTGGYELSSATGWEDAAGIAGLVLAVVTFRAALAGSAIGVDPAARPALTGSCRGNPGREAPRLGGAKHPGRAQISS